MGRRLILDTGILIAFEKGQLDPGQVLNGDDDVAIAAVTVTELIMGVKLSEPKNKAARADALQRARDLQLSLECSHQ